MDTTFSFLLLTIYVKLLTTPNQTWEYIREEESQDSK
jgi:hypothetical protein